MKNKITVRNVAIGYNLDGDARPVKEDWVKLQKLHWQLYNHECQCRGIANNRKPMNMVGSFDYICNANMTYFIEMDGEVVGTFMERNGSIYNLIIREKHRRKGIVRWLFDEYFKGKTLQLQVRESNEVGMAVYEALGFEVLEDWHSYYTMIREAN